MIIFEWKYSPLKTMMGFMKSSSSSSSSSSSDSSSSSSDSSNSNSNSNTGKSNNTGKTGVTLSPDSNGNYTVGKDANGKYSVGGKDSVDGQGNYSNPGAKAAHANDFSVGSDVSNSNFVGQMQGNQALKGNLKSNNLDTMAHNAAMYGNKTNSILGQLNGSGPSGQGNVANVAATKAELQGLMDKGYSYDEALMAYQAKHNLGTKSWDNMTPQEKNIAKALTLAVPAGIGAAGALAPGIGMYSGGLFSSAPTWGSGWAALAAGAGITGGAALAGSKASAEAPDYNDARGSLVDSLLGSKDAEATVSYNPADAARDYARATNNVGVESKAPTNDVDTATPTTRAEVEAAPTVNETYDAAEISDIGKSDETVAEDSTPAEETEEVVQSNSNSVRSSGSAPSNNGSSGSLQPPSRDSSGLGLGVFKDGANYDNDAWNRGMQEQSSSLVSDEQCKLFAKKAFHEGSPHWSGVKKIIIEKIV